jgi:hypothetical protein
MTYQGDRKQCDDCLVDKLNSPRLCSSFQRSLGLLQIIHPEH